MMIDILTIDIISIIIVFILLLLIIIGHIFKIHHHTNKRFVSNVVYSPCFGTVSKIVSTPTTNKIHVNLLLMDNHTQYFPIDGTITNVSKIGSAHHNIFSRKSADNEHEIVDLDTKVDKVSITRRSGAYFSNIISYFKKGDKVSAGQLMGVITMGSHCIIEIPSDLTLLVKPGTYIYAGKTPLAQKI
jgi:phosphatidylserine decarboxylase precursor-related protein